MSKTVTLEVSDSTSIELDFFFQLSFGRDAAAGTWSNPKASLICCSVSRITTRPHRRGELDRLTEILKSKDRYTLESRVLEIVKKIIVDSQGETDPRRVAPSGATMAKFIHASLNLYIEDMLQQIEDLNTNGLI